ncbi:30S ribosomal protein S3P, partial [mine drainage metagenome]
KRNLMDTSIRLVVNKPGLVIGRRGSKVQEIEETLRRRFQIEAPRIEVMEVKNPDLNPQIISKKIAMSLEKGWAYRKAGNTALRRIIESDARGVMIKIGGKISGERARSQKFFYGSIKYSGEPARSGIGYGYSVAKLKLGVIGVTVRLLNKEYRLPDDIIV